MPERSGGLTQMVLAVTSRCMLVIGVVPDYVVRVARNGSPRMEVDACAAGVARPAHADSARQVAERDAERSADPTGPRRGPVYFGARMAIAAGIFRQYDIRGIVGKDFTTEAARAIGGAYAAYMAEPTSAAPSWWVATIGRAATSCATRSSRGSPRAGVDVVDIGVVPTPLAYWALHHLPSSAASRSPARTIPRSTTDSSCRRHESMHGEEIRRLYELTQSAGTWPSGKRIGSRGNGDRSISRRRRRAHRGNSRAPIRSSTTAATEPARSSRRRCSTRLGVRPTDCSVRATARFRTIIPIRPFRRTSRN